MNFKSLIKNSLGFNFETVTVNGMPLVILVKTPNSIGLQRICSNRDTFRKVTKLIFMVKLFKKAHYTCYNKIFNCKSYIESSAL